MATAGVVPLGLDPQPWHRARDRADTAAGRGQFAGHMAVAQVVGGGHKGEGVVAGYLAAVFRRGADGDGFAVAAQQHRPLSTLYRGVKPAYRLCRIGLSFVAAFLPLTKVGNHAGCPRRLFRPGHRPPRGPQTVSWIRSWGVLRAIKSGQANSSPKAALSKPIFPAYGQPCPAGWSVVED